MCGAGVVVRVMLAVGAGGAAAASAAEFKVHIPNVADARAVHLALAGAAGRLESDRCQEVLTRFRDRAGRTLRTNLEVSGQTPSGYLQGIWFYPGSHLAVCQSRRVFAVTSPGSHVVFVCLPQFRNHQWAAGADAEVVIIHEMLHSLGLGEDPPSTEEISYAVQRACVP